MPAVETSEVGRAPARVPSRMLAGVAFAAYLAVAFFDGGQGESATSAIAVVAWAVIAVAVVRHSPAVPRGLAALTALSMAGLTVLIGLSATWAGDDGRVFVELVRALAYTGVLLIVLVGLRTGGGHDLLMGLAAAIAAIAALALLSRLLPDLLTGDRTFLDQFPEAVRGRLSYPIDYWNGLAAVMATAVVLFGWLGGSAESLRVRAAAVAVLPVTLLVLYLTGSRGGLIAAVAGVGLYLALAPVRARALVGIAIGVAGGLALAALAATDQDLIEGVAGRAAELWMLGAVLVVSAAAYQVRLRVDSRLARPDTPRLLRGTALGIAALVTAGALVALVFAADDVNRGGGIREGSVDEFGRGEFTGRFLAAGSNGRAELWSAALDAYASEPVHGIGAGAYGFWWNQNGTLREPARDAHSLFLEVLAELGPAGLLATLAFFGAGAVAVARRTYGDHDGTVAAAGGVLAAGFLGAGLDWTWEVPAAFALPLIAVGLLCGRGCDRPGDPERPPLRSRLFRALALVAAFVSMVLAGSLFLSERALDRSRQHTADGDLPAAAEAARDASRFQPLSSGPWLQLGLIQLEAGDFDGATESLEEASALSPESPQIAIVLSVVYQVAEDPRFEQQRARAEALLPANR